MWSRVEVEWPPGALASSDHEWSDGEDPGTCSLAMLYSLQLQYSVVSQRGKSGCNISCTQECDATIETHSTMPWPAGQQEPPPAARTSSSILRPEHLRPLPRISYGKVD